MQGIEDTNGTVEKKAEDFIPRPYQIDLYEQAVKRNTIIYLPTGAGKTFIAVLLIKRFSNDFKKSYSQGGKCTIFAVNTVPLVKQQSEYIARLTGLSCGAYTGEMQVDYWKEGEWLKQLDENQVLVMTAQICLDILSHGYMQLRQINLLIFDECHRAVSDHPMRLIMQHFENYPINEHPRVLAMSATLLNSNVSLPKIESTIKSLETTFHAKIATVETSNVKAFSTNPSENFILYAPYVKPPIEKRVDDIVKEMQIVLNMVSLDINVIQNVSSAVFLPKSKNSKLAGVLNDISMQFSHTGIYGASKSVLLHLIQLECIKKHCSNTQTTYVLEYLITGLTKIRKLLEDEMKDCTDLEKIHNFSSDQVRKLFSTLKDFHNKISVDRKFSCIVFVERRFTAKVLYHILKNLQQHDESYKFLMTDYVVGFSNDPYKNSKEVLCISKWNHEVLRKFRNGQTNCIIATDVVDEGIDVPICTLIIRYNLPTNFRAYIQSKGRARSQNSYYTLMIANNDTEFPKKYQHYKNMEIYLRRFLVGKTHLRDGARQMDIRRELYHHDILPYTVTKNGVTSVLTENIAISLVNRYSSMLYKSKLVMLTPTWNLHEIEQNINETIYQVSLKLPITSPFKQVIYGDPMPAIDKAKRSAAMKMCIELHKIGELSDHLLPHDANYVPKDVDYLFPNWVDEKDEDVRKIGTYKKKRQHKLVYPSSLFSAFPKAGELLYLHIINIKPMYIRPHDNRNLVFYNLLSNKAGFGILSTKSMPPLPSFPLFMNVGELHANIKTNHGKFRLIDEQIQSLLNFHTLMFTNIVQIIKKFMVLDVDNLDNSFLIVPVGENLEINWEVVQNHQTMECISPSVPIRFKQNDYELALVKPTYRGSLSVYIVTRVYDDLTPNSCFPTEDFDSYVHYYKERHGIEILDPKQPMLEVKPISNRIQCIRPMSMKRGLSKRKLAEMREDFEEDLVPELCCKVNFPALYWLKCTILPSVLHRISQLLIADELRSTIASEALSTQHIFDENHVWPPVVIAENDEEEEELLENPLDTTCEDIVETTQYEPELSGPEVDILDTDANLYPWTKDQEPPDLDRNIDQIQMIDIEYYYQFMTGISDSTIVKVKTKNSKFMAKPIVPVPPLNILSKKAAQGPNPVQVMHALTSTMGHDVFNLERLETLGDSFLKFMVSLALYVTFPFESEGRLTTLKGRLIGNRNLYYCGVSRNIPGHIKVDDFEPLINSVVPAFTTFRPLQNILLDAGVSPNVLYELHIPVREQLTGRLSDSTLRNMEEKVLNWTAAESQTGMEHFLGVQTVADKTVADSVEALIGAYLQSSGVKGATSVLKWFKILPQNLKTETLFGVAENPIIAEGDINIHMPWASNIEQKLGYKFKNRGFLLQAFTHPSYSANGVTECYQRLEFLGDAILDFLITSHIYDTCGNLSPGALTDLRSALVNNITFACLAVRYALHTALLSFVPKLNDLIDRFVKFQEERNHVVDDEILIVLLEEEECNLVEYIDVPKVLGDLFESTVGAIFLDCGKNLATVWEIVYSLMHKEIDAFSKNVPKNPIRVIHEIQGAHPTFLTATLIEGRETVMVPLKVVNSGKMKIFHGFGSNKKQAKCAAAKLALKSLLSKT